MVLTQSIKFANESTTEIRLEHQTRQNTQKDLEREICSWQSIIIVPYSLQIGQSRKGPDLKKNKSVRHQCWIRGEEQRAKPKEIIPTCPLPPRLMSSVLPPECPPFVITHSVSLCKCCSIHFSTGLLYSQK